MPEKPTVTTPIHLMSSEPALASANTGSKLGPPQSKKMKINGPLSNDTGDRSTSKTTPKAHAGSALKSTAPHSSTLKHEAVKPITAEHNRLHPKPRQIDSSFTITSRQVSTTASARPIKLDQKREFEEVVEDSEAEETDPDNKSLSDSEEVNETIGEDSFEHDLFGSFEEVGAEAEDQ